MTPQELKYSIICLALQGKLAEQYVDDKPVDISNIKQKQTEEYEFDLPEKWMIGHIETVTKIIPSRQYQILESEVLKEGKYAVISQSKEYSIGFSNDESKVFHHNEPVIVFGDHTTEIKYVNFDFVVGADGVKIFLPDSRIIFAKFFYYVMLFNSNGLNKVGGYSRHYKYIKDKAIPLPPLAEQKRIVAKIEELLPYIERYEKAWNKLEELNKRFPIELQKSILQMAIQGKLVEQRPEEGTGEELYQQIQGTLVHKEQGNRKRKSKNVIFAVPENDLPFEIPESWKWVRLGEIGYTNIGLTYNPQNQTSDGTIVLRSNNIRDGQINYEDIVRVSMDIPENKMCHIGDILICARNGSKRLVGKAAIVDREGMSFGAFMAIYRSICNPYVLYVINSAYFRNSLLEDTGTTTINQITQDMLKNALIPLPPIAEQKRIVAKLEEILPLCEKLKKT